VHPIVHLFCLGQAVFIDRPAHQKCTVTSDCGSLRQSPDIQDLWLTSRGNVRMANMPRGWSRRVIGNGKTPHFSDRKAIRVNSVRPFLSAPTKEVAPE